MWIKTKTLGALLFASAVAIGCGGGDGKKNEINNEIPCKTGNCGKESFRKAIPSKNSVSIDFRASRAKKSDTALLESRSPELMATQEYVDEINGTIAAVFEGVEELAGNTPEISEDNLHMWRVPSEDVAGMDELLLLSTDDGVNYDIAVEYVPAGEAPSGSGVVLDGEVGVDGDGDISTFDLRLDFDAVDIGVTGNINLRAAPFDGGLREIWYDFDGFGEVGGDLETSITTYWAYDLGDGGLEYIGDNHGEETTVFVRWDESGGRYDHHVAYSADGFGLVDEIVTNCWDSAGGEVFDGVAVINRDQEFYGELDGDEADCAFGPADGHPNPTEDFANLPGEGEWDDIDFLGEGPEECDPDFEECEEECDPDFEECEEECDPDFEECEEECDPDFEECEEECDPDFEECEDECVLDCSVYSACSCGPSDPCGWEGDGYCDLDGPGTCSDFSPTFDDDADCF